MRSRKFSERCAFTASDFDLDELTDLVEVMQAYGLDARVVLSKSGKRAKVEVESLPLPSHARHVVERGTPGKAGRPRKAVGPLVSPKNGLEFETCGEFLAWAEGKSAQECADSFGMGRSTYFRKLKAIRAADPSTPLDSL